MVLVHFWIGKILCHYAGNPRWAITHSFPRLLSFPRAGWEGLPLRHPGHALGPCMGGGTADERRAAGINAACRKARVQVGVLRAGYYRSASERRQSHQRPFVYPRRYL
jgi:hypothetical protein